MKLLLWTLCVTIYCDLIFLSEMYIQYAKYANVHMDCTVFTNMHVQYICMYICIYVCIPIGDIDILTSKTPTTVYTRYTGYISDLITDISCFLN